MQPLSVVGVICEDIREEKSGAISLIGIMPDNAKVPFVPPSGQMIIVPRIAFYARIHFDPSQQLGEVKLDLILPDGTILPLGEIEQKVIAAAREDSKISGAPISGVVSRAVISSLPLKSLGRIILQVTIGELKYVAAAVNFTTEDIKSSGVELSHEVFHRF